MNRVCSGSIIGGDVWNRIFSGGIMGGGKKGRNNEDQNRIQPIQKL